MAIRPYSRNKVALWILIQVKYTQVRANTELVQNACLYQHKETTKHL